MKRSIWFALLPFVLLAVDLPGQTLVPTSVTTPTPVETPVPTPTPQKRGFFGRMLHPFSRSSPRLPQYHDPKIRGLVVDLQVTSEPVKLSEVRQLEVKTILRNKSKKPITLDFPTDQRVEIYLRNSTDDILTKWSDNHAPTEKPGTVVVNADESIEYPQTIATRELAPNKVFIVEVFFPKYPELRARQKFMTAP